MMAKIYTVTIDHKEKGKKTSQKKKVVNTILLFVVILIGLATGGYFLKKFASSCEENNCNPFIKPFVNTIEPELNQDNGLTNILIVGVDTRENNPGLMNTDTIIIATIDHNNKTAVLTSIPRDLWVRFELPNGKMVSSKINSAYAFGEWQGRDQGYGIDTLKGAVETIIGQPIHYHVKITLQGFTDIVDTIGGVDIEIPEYYKDAYPYEELPQELQATCAHFYHDGHYCLFQFKEGTEHMDGLRALIYARCRLLSPRGDFDRAQRQQIVIDAVNKKVLSSQTLLDPVKLWELYKIVEENIENSPFTINDIRAGLNLKTEFDPENIGHVVLDPDLGHVPGKYIYRPHDVPSRGYYIEVRDHTYQEIQEVLEYVRRYPRIYNEEAKISIYNATGNARLEIDYAAKIKIEHPFFLFQDTNKIISNPENKYQGISIYKFAENEKPATEEYLKQFFKVNEIITEPEDGTRNLLNEDFVIVIGNSSLDGE